jgi:Tfp pilus assembly protein FimT
MDSALPGWMYPIFTIGRSAEGVSPSANEDLGATMVSLRHKKPTAFTMFEMIFVIAIAAIVAGVAIAMMGDSDTTAALAGAQIVLQDLEFAQSEAIARRSPITVTFNVGEGTYTVSDGANPITNPITKGDYVVDLSQAAANGRVNLSSVDFGGGSAVSFNSFGEPVLPGTDTPISTGDGVLVSCGEATRSILVTPVIGKITAN